MNTQPQPVKIQITKQDSFINTQFISKNRQYNFFFNNYSKKSVLIKTKEYFLPKLSEFKRWISLAIGG